jgi:signal transduction histidine kinase
MLERRSQKVFKFAIVFVMALAISAILGWQFDNQFLKSFFSTIVSMNPLTAICFILSALSVWFLSFPTSHPLYCVGRILCCVIGVIAFLKLQEYMGGRIFGLDRILFKEKLGTSQMALNTALNFLGIAVSLFILDKSRIMFRFAEALLIVGLLISFFAITGYIYDESTFTRAAPLYLPMALNTSITFVALILAIFFSRPHLGLVKTMMGEGTGSIVIRRLLPLVIFLPLMLSIVRLQGERAGYYGTEFGTALFTISVIVLFTWIVWFNAKILNGLDEQRKKNGLLRSLHLEISKTIADSEDLEQSITETLKIICTNLDFEVAMMWYVDKINLELYQGANWSKPEAQFRQFLEACKQMKFRKGKGLAGKVWAQNKSLWVLEVNNEPDFVNTESAKKAQLHTASCFPIKVCGEVIGVMEFFSTSLREPDRSVLQTLDLAGANIGQVMSRKEAQLRTIEAARIKAEFASTVSHELRTPLTVIKGSIDLLIEEILGPITADQKELLVTSKNNVDRLTRLINDVLDYQKLENKRMEFIMGEHDLCKIVNQIALDFNSPIEKKGLKLHREMPDEPLMVYCDNDKIIQVLFNYLSNALKFTEQGSVTVKVERIDGHAKVSVIDEGEGVKEEDKPKLFQSFSQLLTLENRKTGGTGLGLSISKKIIEAHDGMIGMDSVVGKGSTFYFMLKLKDEDEQKNSDGRR